MTNEYPSPPAEQVEAATEANESGVAPTKPVEIRAPERRPPSEAVPTNRIAFSKQLDLLRAYAALSGVERRTVSLAQVAELVGMASATASLANSFFTDAGLLTKTDAGFTPSQSVVEYYQAFDWDPDTAAHKLAPALKSTWGWRAIEGRLRFQPIAEHEAVRVLAEASGASKDYEPQLKILLTYFETANLVSRDGNMLRLVKEAAPQVDVPEKPEKPADREEERPDGAEKPKPPSGGGGGGGSWGGPPVTTSVHPALVGLLQLLPPAREPWRKGKRAWLEAFTSAINAIYPDDGEEDA